MREAMQSEVEAFARGGKIQQIDDNVMADHPKSLHPTTAANPFSCHKNRSDAVFYFVSPPP